MREVVVAGAHMIVPRSSMTIGLKFNLSRPKGVCEPLASLVVGGATSVAFCVPRQPSRCAGRVRPSRRAYTVHLPVPAVAMLTKMVDDALEWIRRSDLAPSLFFWIAAATAAAVTSS